MNDEVKPKAGIKSTEFYGKLIIQLVLILNALFGLGIEIDDMTAMTIVGGMEALYGVGRSITKAPPKSVSNSLRA